MKNVFGWTRISGDDETDVAPEVAPFGRGGAVGVISVGHPRSRFYQRHRRIASSIVTTPSDLLAEPGADPRSGTGRSTRSAGRCSSLMLLAVRAVLDLGAVLRLQVGGQQGRGSSVGRPRRGRSVPPSIPSSRALETQASTDLDGRAGLVEQSTDLLSADARRRRRRDADRREGPGDRARHGRPTTASCSPTATGTPTCSRSGQDGPFTETAVDKCRSPNASRRSPATTRCRAAPRRAARSSDRDRSERRPGGRIEASGV